LRVIITKGQSYEAFRSGFQLINDSLRGFNEQEFPNIFITDQCQAEINALLSGWPNSKSYLCIFHVCQAIW